MSREGLHVSDRIDHRRITRNRQGVRCGKMAVVCRNIPDYRAAIRYEFRMADIPLYCDEPTTPEFSAPATPVRALLALLRGADMT